MFSLFVFQYRACSAEYFLDKMELWEIDLFFDAIPQSDRPLYTMLRYFMYSNLLPNLKKGSKIKVEDVYPLPFDDSFKNKMKNDVQLTKEDLERITQQMTMIAKTIK